MEGKYLQLLLVIIVPIVLILGIVLQTSTNSNFYEKEISKKGIIDEEHTSQENATKIYKEVILFIKSEGVLTERLIGKEATAHMDDVKNLRDLTKYIFYILLTILILGIGALLIIRKPERIGNVMIQGSIITLIINTILFITSKFFFTGFWTKMHTMMFKNDLWQLNPETNRLVAVFTMNFFTEFITRVMLLTTIISIILIIMGIFIQSLFSKNKQPKKQKIEKEEFELQQW